MAQKICLVIGAGCTFSDVEKLSERKKPPLDKGFFSIAKKVNPSLTRIIEDFVNENYGTDIFSRENDSLEAVMARIYTDIYTPGLTDKTREIFRTLLNLFNRRLADTTNELPATRKRYLYRILSDYLKTGVSPDDITIVTFNQDIQIEKVLDKLQKTASYKNMGRIFSFPFCYEMDFYSITKPSRGPKNVFEECGSNEKGIRLLKLHGSLNWYSVHRSSNLSPSAMFNSSRNIYLTCRQQILTKMRYAGGQRREQTLPVIIPPVTHKSAILHNQIRSLWKMAAQSLKEADEILIFGYSCPPLDFESSNLIQRSLKSCHYEALWIIDPDPHVLVRYAELIRPRSIGYFPSAEDYLLSRR